MTKEELSQVQALAQQVCNRWAATLGLEQWYIAAEIHDEIDTVMDFPQVNYYPEIASARIHLITEEVWREMYGGSWAPYNIEIQIVSSLLSIATKNTMDPVMNDYLARVMISFKRRVEELTRIIENINRAPEPETQVEAENPVEPEIVEPEVQVRQSEDRAESEEA